jgi:PiT family inorganic phosphate transporter
MSPVIAGAGAAAGTWMIYRVTVGVAKRFTDNGFRWGQIGSASLVSLAHGTNDAQKTMGVITLALIATGQWTDTENIPFWVKVACALAISLGTYLGGWRIIRTLGKGLVEIAPPQGLNAESAAAAVILSSSHLGFALSTTHVATGSILGSGVGRPGAQVRRRVAGRMVAAWLITLPAVGGRPGRRPRSRRHGELRGTSTCTTWDSPSRGRGRSCPPACSSAPGCRRCSGSASARWPMGPAATPRCTIPG